MQKSQAVYGAILALALSSCAVAPEGQSETAPVGPAVLSPEQEQGALAGQVDFRSHVAPILENRCLPCHDGHALPGQYNVSRRTTAFAAGPAGPRIVPGEPGKSLIFLNPGGTHQNLQVMPPVGNRLTREELAILRRWINQGAVWPAGQAGVLTR